LAVELNLKMESQPLSFGSQGEPTLDDTDYELLKHALQNEKAAPELLPYEDELVQRVYLQLEHQVRSFPKKQLS
jgi:hypothetical protein